MSVFQTSSFVFTTPLFYERFIVQLYPDYFLPVNYITYNQSFVTFKFKVNLPLFRYGDLFITQIKKLLNENKTTNYINNSILIFNA